MLFVSVPQDILNEVNKELSLSDQRKAEGKGHRMVIEETDGEDSDTDSAVEEIVIKGEQTVVVEEQVVTQQAGVYTI